MPMEHLNQRLGIPGIARFDEGEGGLARLTLTTPDAAAEIYLHGAHVTQYRRRGQPPVLWMSRKSWFEPTRPIRGGVPVIFPWFGARTGEAPPGAASPNHGFARLMVWHPDAVVQERDEVRALFSLHPTASTRATWPYEFELRFTVTLAPGCLRMTLEVENTDAKPFRFEEALHTYFTVGDVRQVKVHGLEGASYLDKVANGPVRQPAQPITVAGETDRLYTGTTAECVLDDASLGRRISVRKRGSNSTVVWNPWTAKAAAMPDFDDHEWPGMICIETANAAADAVTLPPGETHVMEAEIA